MSESFARETINQLMEHCGPEETFADTERKLRQKIERLEAALREIAAEASVTVHTWKNGINFKKMYEGWRKIAVERIDIARAALTTEDRHE